MKGPQTPPPTRWGRTGHRRPSTPPVGHELLARKFGYRLMPGRLPRKLSWPRPLTRSRAPSNDDGATFASPLTLCRRTRRGKGPTQRTTHWRIAREMGYPPMRRPLCGTLPTPRSTATSTRGGPGRSHGCACCVLCCRCRSFVKREEKGDRRKYLVAAGGAEILFS